MFIQYNEQARKKWVLNDHLYDKYQTSANSTRLKIEMIVIYIYKVIYETYEHACMKPQAAHTADFMKIIVYQRLRKH